MKVLMVSKALVSGAYHKKLEALVHLGVDLHLVIPTDWAGRAPETRAHPLYQIHVLPLLLSGQNHLHFYRGFSSVVSRVRPDVFHIDEEHYSVVTFQAMRLARKFRIPSLFFTWQNIWKRYPVVFRHIEQYTFCTAAAAIAGNEEARAVLIRKGFDRPIAVIPQFGVDPDQFRRLDRSALRREAQIDDGRFVVGFVGRLVPEKGVDTLLDAVARLDASALLVLVGGGPLRASLVQRATDFGIADRVRLIDQVSSLSVQKFLNCLDCLVLPSLTRRNWKEQFGRVLIEAMACEVPVVGSDSGEIPRVIGGAGLIFPEGDVNALVDRLRRIKDEPTLRIGLGAAGRERVLKHFTHRTIAEATYRVYDSIPLGGGDG